jgi:excisionase family DNA binding protein
MKIFKQLNDHSADSQPPVSQPVPMRPKRIAAPDEGSQLADLSGVARRLGVSKRYVQVLVRRRVIPVIKLGRRCTRFDLDDVLTAVRKFEVEAQS